MTPELQEQSRQYRLYQSRSFYNSLDSYRPMMSDSRRNEFYVEILKEVKGKVVLDIGAGIGALSLAALGAGAERVYAVEMNPEACKFLTEMKEELKLEKLTVINTTSWELQLPEQVDFIVHEIFGSFLLDELCLVTLSDLKKHLKTSGKFLPEEFGFLFKLYGLETQVSSVKKINQISNFYSRLNRGQIVVEDIITDDITENSIEFGPFDFVNYPLDELENGIRTKKETVLDSLWVVPYIKHDNKKLFLCKQDVEHHWGNSFLGLGKNVTLEPGVDINMKFWIDQNLSSFNTGISLS